MAQEDTLLQPPSWETIESDKEYQSLPPEAKAETLGNWAKATREFGDSQGWWEDPDIQKQFTESSRAKLQELQSQFKDIPRGNLLDRANLGVQEFAPRAMGAADQLLSLATRFPEIAIPLMDPDPIRAQRLVEQYKGMNKLGQGLNEMALNEAQKAQEISAAGQALKGGPDIPILGNTGDLVQSAIPTTLQAVMDIGLSGGSGTAQSLQAPAKTAIEAVMRNAASPAVRQAATVAGGEQALSTLNQEITERVQSGETPQQAQANSLPKAISSGLVTAMTTAFGGFTGAESVLKESGVMGLKSRIIEVLKESGMEATEETLDQAGNQIAGWVNDEFDPSKKKEGTWQERLSKSVNLKELAQSGFLGGIIGGNMTAIAQTAEAIRDNAIVKQAAVQSKNLEANDSPATAQAVEEIAATEVVDNKIESQRKSASVIDELLSTPAADLSKPSVEAPVQATEETQFAPTPAVTPAVETEAGTEQPLSPVPSVQGVTESPDAAAPASFVSQETHVGDTQEDFPVESEQQIPKLPSVQPGFVRFYHGGNSETGGGGRWVSPDYSYAKGYADRLPNGVVQYVDIPESSPLLKKSYDDSGGAIPAPYISFEAPEEIMAQAKPATFARVEEALVAGETPAPEDVALAQAQITTAQPEGEPNAIETVTQQEGLQVQPEDGIEGRETAQASISDSVLSEAQGQEVAVNENPPIQQDQPNVPEGVQQAPTASTGATEPAQQQPQRVQLRGNPQTFTITRALPQTDAERANDEHSFEVVNDRTGETQVIERNDIAHYVKPKSERVKKAIKKLPAKQQAKAESATEISTEPDPYQGVPLTNAAPLPSVNIPLFNELSELGVFDEDATAPKVLQKIADSKSTPDWAKTLSKRLLALGTAMDIQAVNRPDSSWSALYVGGENPATLINLSRRNPGAALSILHEASHRATLEQIRNPDKLTGEARKAYDELVAIHKEISAMPEFQGEYGISNVEEMVAEAFSNAGFRKKLDRVRPGQKQTLWQRFVNAIARVLFNKPAAQTSLLHSAVENAFTLAGAPIIESRDGSSAAMAESGSWPETISNPNASEAAEAKALVEATQELESDAGIDVTPLTPEQQQLLQETDTFKPLGLTALFARQFSNIPGTDFNDRQSEAVQGLVKAAKSYDAAKGVSFPQYAAGIIRNHMRDYAKSRKIRSKYVTPDQPVYSEEDAETIVSTAPSPQETTIAENDRKRMQGVAREALQAVMSQASERDRTILRGYASGQSLREIGAEVGLSQEGVKKTIIRYRTNVEKALFLRGINDISEILAPVEEQTAAETTRQTTPEDEQAFQESTVGTLEAQDLEQGRPIYSDEGLVDEGVFAADSGEIEALAQNDAVSSMSKWISADNGRTAEAGRDADLEAFRSGASTRTLEPTDARAARRVLGNDVNFNAFAGELEKIFGKRIVFLTDLPSTAPSALFLKSNPDAIYINVNGNYPLMFLTGHEFGHSLKAKNKVLYEDLQQFVLDNATDWTAYKNNLINNKGYSESQAADEFTEDFIGAHFNDGKFWRRLWQKDKPLFERLVDAAMDFLNALTGRASSMSRDVRPFFKNWEETRDKLVSIVEQAKSGNQDLIAPMAERAIPESNKEIASQFEKGLEGQDKFKEVITQEAGQSLDSILADVLSKPAESVDDVYRRIGEAFKYEYGFPDFLTEKALDFIKSKVDAKALPTGPGAANINEPLQGYELRSFGERFVKDRAISQDIRDETGNRYYPPIPNQTTADEARRLIEQNGVDDAISQIKDESNGLPFHTRATVGQIVIKKLNQEYNSLKASNPVEAEIALRKATDLAEWQMEYGTRLGQGVQSFAMYSRLTPEGKLLSYQKSVRKARERFKKSQGEKVKEIIDTLNNADDKEKAAKELAKRNSVAKTIKDKLGELVQQSKDGTLTEEVFYEKLAKKLGLPENDPKVAARILELAQKIDEAAEGIPKDRATLELTKYIAQQKGFAPSDVPFGMYYGHILSGYNTHIVNAIDTFFNVFTETTGLAITNPRAAANIYSGLFRGLGEGRADALLALTEGRIATGEKWMDVPKLLEVAEFGKKGGVPINTQKKFGKVIKTISESPVAYPLNAYKYIGRALSAVDSLNFRGAKEANAALLAYRVAESEGLTGDALVERMNDLLALNRMSSLLEYARNEGFQGHQALARAIELREALRDSGISDASSEFASEATYNHEPHGALGQISNTVGNLSNKLPVLKIFVPFTRIVANVTNRGLNYTPVGYKRAYLGYTGEEAPTGDQRKQMLARANLGTAGLTALGILHALGIIAINGAGPSDDDKRKQLQAAGWKPYSIKIGNKYYNYTYTPIGLGLSILGNTFDSYKYGELSRQDAGTRAAYALLRVGSTVFSQSFLSGLSNLFSLIGQDPGRSIGAGKGIISSTVSGFTTPTIFRDVARLFDNKSYQSNSIGQDMIRNTPFAALALNPSLNVLGEPIKLPRQRFFTTASNDPVWKMVVEKNLRIPVPSKTTPLKPGGLEPLSPDQYYEYVKVSGQRLKAWMEKNQSRLEKMTTEDADEAIAKESERIHKLVLPKIRKM